MAQGFQKDLLKRFLIDFIQIDLKMKNLVIIQVWDYLFLNRLLKLMVDDIEALNRLNQKNECLGGSVKVTFPEVLKIKFLNF